MQLHAHNANIFAPTTSKKRTEKVCDLYGIALADMREFARHRIDEGAADALEALVLL